ncbi:efflux transporter outer membrane subunit [Denitromonas iodatirespirans]|uniref:Efflux transporter outer membrane subunit n=1 Tax=Denitromonas iodatirespirans TaxID=2795389 RepID=A0A944D5N8_DENI1|nr:efflux transporter outer membrane subunit [Denitromonas iodatirespirans]MBT0960435.1 efflux transporter outer membrane subunit [Denitromonas iodatirespirans]
MKTSLRSCSTRLGVGALAVFMAGCATLGPDYQAPVAAVPEAWHAAPASGSATGSASIERWWQQLGDASLSELIDQALRANPDLQAARAAVQASRAQERVARAGQMPSVGASGNASASGRGDAAVSERWTAGFDAGWEIDIFGGVRRGVEAARADREAASANLANTHASLAAEVALNYVTLRTGQARLAIARRNLAAQQETLQLTDWRAQAGLASSVEVEQARTNTEQTRAQIPSLQTGIASAANRLAVLTGQAPGALQTTLADGGLPAVPTAIAVGIPAEVLRQRPDVQAAERALAAETARIGVAEAARWPGFTLSGSIGLEAVTFGALGNGASVLRTLAAGIGGVLFDGGALAARVEQQGAVREQRLHSYRSTVLAALEDVENALTALDNTARRRDALAAASAAARNAKLLAADRYRSGLIDFQTMLDTERSLLSTEDSLASAEGERLSALIQLYKALGGGWSRADLTEPADNPQDKHS